MCANSGSAESDNQVQVEICDKPKWRNQQRGGERPFGRRIWDDSAESDKGTKEVVITEKWGRRYACDSCRITVNGAKSAFMELVVLETHFVNRLSTARGLGFGLDDLSSKVIRIPINTRKNITITAEAAITLLFLIITMNFNY